MTPSRSQPVHEAGDRGAWMHALLRRLFPICRSLAGPGNRETLRVLGETLPLKITDVPTGTKVFDWVIPEEWTPRAAEITGPDGRIHARFADHNLHLVSHSEPIDLKLDREELLGHVYSLPQQPDIVPYVTRYYKRGWGFCMTEHERSDLLPGKYRARIDADLKPGALSFGEALLPGDNPSEVLVSTYMCHPSMANDNLSGVVAASGLYHALAARSRRRFSYRFLFVPETIGSIAWLWNNRDIVKGRTAAGLVLSCVGNEGPFTWKESRLGNTFMDRVMFVAGGERMKFTPVTGSDERQFCSPGFDLPVVMLSRNYPGTFPFYHTSADTPEKTPPAALAATLVWLERICDTIERSPVQYRRTDPHGEPMLSRHGLYHTLSRRKESGFDRVKDPRSAMMWVLSFSDGNHDLLAIAEHSGLSIDALAGAAEQALAAGLIEAVTPA